VVEIGEMIVQRGLAMTILGSDRDLDCFLDQSDSIDLVSGSGVQQCLVV
jgi:hypothetical protein